MSIDIDTKIETDIMDSTENAENFYINRRKDGTGQWELAKNVE